MHFTPDKPPGQWLSEFAAKVRDGQRASIELAIWEQYGATGAIMVLDMSGFSVVTRTINSL